MTIIESIWSYNIVKNEDNEISEYYRYLVVSPQNRLAKGIENVLPHYQMVKDNYLDGRKLYEDVTFADSWGETFYVFVDGTYLLVEEGQTTLFGEAYRISDGTMEKISELGDVLLIEG